MSKDWYTSKSIWAGFAATAAGILGIFGISVLEDPAFQAQIALVLSGLGAIVFRFVTKTAIAPIV